MLSLGLNSPQTPGEDPEKRKAAGEKCLHCGSGISVFARMRGWTDFCSGEHMRLYLRGTGHRADVQSTTDTVPERTGEQAIQPEALQAAPLSGKPTAVSAKKTSKKTPSQTSKQERAVAGKSTAKEAAFPLVRDLLGLIPIPSELLTPQEKLLFSHRLRSFGAISGADEISMALPQAAKLEVGKLDLPLGGAVPVWVALAAAGTQPKVQVIEPVRAELNHGRGAFQAEVRLPIRNAKVLGSPFWSGEQTEDRNPSSIDVASAEMSSAESGVPVEVKQRLRNPDRQAARLAVVAEAMLEQEIRDQEVPDQKITDQETPQPEPKAQANGGRAKLVQPQPPQSEQPMDSIRLAPMVALPEIALPNVQQATSAAPKIQECEFSFAANGTPAMAGLTCGDLQPIANRMRNICPPLPTLKELKGVQAPRLRSRAGMFEAEQLARCILPVGVNESEDPRDLELRASRSAARTPVGDPAVGKFELASAGSQQRVLRLRRAGIRQLGTYIPQMRFNVLRPRLVSRTFSGDLIPAGSTVSAKAIAAKSSQVARQQSGQKRSDENKSGRDTTMTSPRSTAEVSMGEAIAADVR